MILGAIKTDTGRYDKVSAKWYECHKSRVMKIDILYIILVLFMIGV